MQLNIFLNSLKNDVRLQYRNGFYFAALFITVIYIGVFTFIGTEHITPWLPIILFGNTQFSTFYFMAGIIFLEKDEGTIFAQAVSPQNTSQYLLSKSISLSLLIGLENLVLVILCDASISITLVSAILFTGIFYCLIGVICAMPFRNISTFILPSIIMTAIASLPFLHYIGAWRHPLFYLHPFTAPLYAFDAAFNPVSSTQTIYIVSALTITWAILYWSAIKICRRVVYYGA